MANTVNLDLTEYNRLRDFKENIKKDKTYQSIHVNEYNGRNSFSVKHYLFSIDNAVQILNDANTTLSNRVKELENTNLTSSELKNMSWWQFRKWKRNIKKV